MGVLSAVESAWTARFINAAGPDLEPREDAFPCLRLIEHIATRTTGVRRRRCWASHNIVGLAMRNAGPVRACTLVPPQVRQDDIAEVDESSGGYLKRADQVDRRLAPAPRQSPASIRTSTLAGPTEKTTFTIASRQ
jgi:hypothetical protein